MIKKREEVTQFFKTNALAISLQLVGVLVVFFNLWIATKLSPVAEDIQVIKSRVQAIEFTQTTLVRKDEFTQVIIRLDKISGRLDTLIAQHLR